MCGSKACEPRTGRQREEGLGNSVVSQPSQSVSSRLKRDLVSKNKVENLGGMTPGVDHSGEMELDDHIGHFWVSAWKKQGFVVSLEMGFISLWGGASFSAHLFCFLPFCHLC